MNIKNDDPTKNKLIAWNVAHKAIDELRDQMQVARQKLVKAEEDLITHLLPSNAKTDEKFAIWLSLPDGAERLLEIGPSDNGMARAVNWRSK